MRAVVAAFVPLVDAAPLIVAREMGFAEEEGITLELRKAPSWSSVRDMLAFGHVHAAHLLSPMPIAMALGQGTIKAQVSVLQVLSLGGTIIGVSAQIGAALAQAGHRFDFADARGALSAISALNLDEPLRIGVPFPFSMHAELLHYWLEDAVAKDLKVEVKTIPPPAMANALAANEIDAFCVGEPWASLAVETGVARLLLPSRAIWTAAPEKVLGATNDWIDSDPASVGKLMRAVWKAGRWLADPASHTIASEMLARSEFLDIPPELIDRGLTGKFVVSQSGETSRCQPFLEFFDGGATFPWRSQAAWIAARMAKRLGLDPKEAATTAQSLFRTDLYREHLNEIGASLPSASAKIEGGIGPETAVASVTGRLVLGQNTFFDDQIFDPDLIS